METGTEDGWCRQTDIVRKGGGDRHRGWVMQIDRHSEEGEERQTDRKRKGGSLRQTDRGWVGSGNGQTDR